MVVRRCFSSREHSFPSSFTTIYSLNVSTKGTYHALNSTLAFILQYTAAKDYTCQTVDEYF